MKTLTALALSLLIALALQLTLKANVRCFGTGERTEGKYKICYYDCLGDTVAITIASTKLCPLSIEKK